MLQINWALIVFRAGFKLSDFELNLKLNHKKKKEREKLRSDSRGKSLTKEISHVRHRRGRLAAAAAEGEALRHHSRRREGSPASRPTAPPEKLGEATRKGGGGGGRHTPSRATAGVADAPHPRRRGQQGTNDGEAAAGEVAALPSPRYIWEWRLREAYQ